MARSLALAHLSALDADPPRLVRAAAEAGFDAVTVRLSPSSSREELYPMSLGSPMLAETVQALRDTAVDVLEVEVLRLRPDTAIPTVEPMLEAAALLGARHLLVVGTDTDEFRVTANFAALCALCGQFAIRAVLEFVPFTTVPTMQDARRIVSRAGHPAAGILVDPLHLRRSGGEPDDVAVLARTAPELLPYAQLCDARLAAPEGGTRALYREAVEDRLLPGQGELPLESFEAAMPLGAPLSVETPVRALASIPVEERVRRIARAVRRSLPGAERQ